MICEKENESWTLVLMVKWELRLKEDVSEVLYVYEDEHDRIFGAETLELPVSSI